MTQRDEVGNERVILLEALFDDVRVNLVEVSLEFALLYQG